MRRRSRKPETDIQLRVARIYACVGGRVKWLSQPRQTMQTPGLGDLYILLPRGLGDVWHETKTPTGRTRKAQLEFAAECKEADVPYVKGGADEAWAFLERVGLVQPGTVELTRQTGATLSVDAQREITRLFGVGAAGMDAKIDIVPE